VVLIAALFGLLVGSFLNVVVYRVPRHLSVAHPGSFCPQCRAEVRWYDNVPVASWLVLRGRCRHCSCPIPVRYLLVEAGTAALFAATAAAVGRTWAVPGLCVLAATILAGAVIEADGQEPPRSVAVVGTALGGLGLVAAALVDGHWAPVAAAAVGAGAGALVGAAADIRVRRGGRGPAVGASGPGALAAFLPLGVWAGWLGAAPALGALLAVLVGSALGRVVRSDRTSWTRWAARAGGAAALVALVVAAGEGPGRW
jgi:leader peptidase (prepilin peptidase) / N-methyltransferase